MIPATPFYMIRHGQSEANAQEIAAGNFDTPLTDLGCRQAAEARMLVEALEIKPRTIIHSHLVRARDTASIINEKLKLPMHEVPHVAEHHVGEWEQKPWEFVRPRMRQKEDPPGGETHLEFAQRIKTGLSSALAHEGPVLVVCHGGVFRALGALYGIDIYDIKNCCLYHFEPDPANESFPWKMQCFSE